MPTDPKTLPEKYPGYLADHGWKHVTREHPRPAPPVGIFDPPAACCIALNQLWSSHIIGALGALMQPDSWTGDSDEQWRAIQEIEKFINRCVQPCEEDCGMFLLRQNPANKCQLQQSLDGGLSWSLAFDFSLCALAAIENTTYALYVQNITNQYNQQITNITNQYDGTPGSVAPETVYDSDPDESALKDRALCYAINRAVTVMCDALVAGIEKSEGQLGLVALAIAAGAAIFIGATFLTGGLAAVAALGEFATAGLQIAGAASGFLTWVTSVIGSHTKEPFQDMTARADVACCWYNALKGATVTEDAFKHSLDGCSFEGNAQVIRDALHGANQTEAQYLQFLQLFKQSIAAERADLLPPCPCEDSGIAVSAAAEPPGVDSGYDLTGGHTYHISAAGTWNGGAGADCDGSGHAGETNPAALVPAANLYSLVYRVGTSGAWTLAGTSADITPAAGGRLYFACNDVPGTFADNTGSLTVTVTAL